MTKIERQLACIVAVGRCYDDLCTPEPPFNIGTFVRLPFVDIVHIIGTVEEVKAYQKAYALFGNIETGLERMVDAACATQISLIEEGHIEQNVANKIIHKKKNEE